MDKRVHCLRHYLLPLKPRLEDLAARDLWIVQSKFLRTEIPSQDTRIFIYQSQMPGQILLGQLRKNPTLGNAQNQGLDGNQRSTQQDEEIPAEDTPVMLLDQPLDGKRLQEQEPLRTNGAITLLCCCSCI